MLCFQHILNSSHLLENMCSWTTARRWPCVFVHLTTLWMLCNIMGWGGVGMMTFRALDNMLDATQNHWLGWGGDDDVPCT